MQARNFMSAWSISLTPIYSNTVSFDSASAPSGLPCFFPFSLSVRFLLAPLESGYTFISPLGVGAVLEDVSSLDLPSFSSLPSSSSDVSGVSTSLLSSPLSVSSPFSLLFSSSLDSGSSLDSLCSSPCSLPCAFPCSSP